MKIKAINPKNKYIEIVTSQGNFKISEDCLFTHRFKQGQSLSEIDLKKLEDCDQYHAAYLRVLNRLAYKDRTVAEIKNFLKAEYNLSENDNLKIIERLKYLGYLDDERYLKDYIDLQDSRGYGYHRIKRDLQEKGFKATDIEDQFSYSFAKEYEKAMNYAQTSKNNLKNRNYNKKIQTLKNRLNYRGFDFDVINEVIEDIEIERNPSEELALLKKDYFKVAARYQRKYEGYDLKQRIINALLARGYQMSDIKDILDKMEMEK